MYTQLFRGTGALVKLLFRQQRFKIIIWLIAIVVITLSAASAYPTMYQDEQSRQAFALTMENPAMQAMLGPGYELTSYLNSVGTLFAHEMLLFSAVAVAIMSILLLGRSTRADEEDGRTEIIRALSVGQLSYLSASIIVVVVTNLLLAIFVGFGLLTLGIEGVDLEGSMMYGAILGTTGLVFGSITALFAQMVETSRGTSSLAFAILIISYLVRAIGDVENDTMSLFSPLGWGVHAKVFMENDWWMIILPILVSLFLLGVTFYLNAIRDVGAGFIPTRKGKKHASAFLKTSFGFVVRQQQVMITSWIIGLFLLGASFGAILGDLETYFADIEFMQAFIVNESGNSMTEQFITLLMAIMSLIGTIPAVMVVLKLKGEENKNRTENFYSRAVSRTKLMSSYFLLGIIVTIIMQLAVAFGLWLVGMTVMEDALGFGTTFTSAFAYLPAMWVVVGLTVLLVGAIPRLTGFTWGYVVFCFVVLYLSGILNFPEWVNNLSVFEHIPQIPVEDFSIATTASLIILSILVTLVGYIGYNKRDITG